MKSKFESEILEFYKKVFRLKKLVRKGWELRDVPDPESVADHILGVSLLTLLFSRHLNLDVEKALTIALIHEVGEAIIGDITPSDGVDPNEKSQLEEEATIQILVSFDGADELIELWKDFEFQRSDEGRLVKELDRLEMALQAFQYEQTTNISLEDFFPFVRERLKNGMPLAVFEELSKVRDQANTD